MQTRRRAARRRCASPCCTGCNDGQVHRARAGRTGTAARRRGCSGCCSDSGWRAARSRTDARQLRARRARWGSRSAPDVRLGVVVVPPNACVRPSGRGAPRAASDTAGSPLTLNLYTPAPRWRDIPANPSSASVFAAAAAMPVIAAISHRAARWAGLRGWGAAKKGARTGVRTYGGGNSVRAAIGPVRGRAAPLSSCAACRHELLPTRTAAAERPDADCSARLCCACSGGAGAAAPVPERGQTAWSNRPPNQRSLPPSCQAAVRSCRAAPVLGMGGYRVEGCVCRLAY